MANAMTLTLREDLAQQLLGRPYGELSDVQKSVIDLVATERPTDVDPLMVDERKFGERIADRVAAFGGSWTFILGFALALALWVTWNALTRSRGMAFDPYPFIFLNLVLSTVAAFQAPLILMSQNRSAARDRDAAEYDYIVNLRAELEIMHLHDKVDALRQKEIVELLRQQSEAITLLKAQVAQIAGKKKR